MTVLQKLSVEPTRPNPLRSWSVHDARGGAARTLTGGPGTQAALADGRVT
jgi:hypothetical protein